MKLEWVYQEGGLGFLVEWGLEFGVVWCAHGFEEVLTDGK